MGDINLLSYRYSPRIIRVIDKPEVAARNRFKYPEGSPDWYAALDSYIKWVVRFLDYYEKDCPTDPNNQWPVPEFEDIRHLLPPQLVTYHLKITTAPKAREWLSAQADEAEDDI